MFRPPGRLVAATAVTLACAATIDCTKAPPPASHRTVVRISEGAVAAMRTAAPRLEAMGVRFEIVAFSGSGSHAVMDALRRSAIDLGAVTSDASYLAFTGQLDSALAPFSTLRGITVLNFNTIHFLVGKNNPAHSIRDLRGSRISLGAPNSAVALLAERLLNAEGLTLRDVRGTQLPNVDATKRLATGELDAAFVLSAAPTPLIVAAAKEGVRLLEIEGPRVEHLRLEHPFLARTLVPRGTYAGQDRAVRTIGVDLILVCRADLDEHFVYSFLQDHFDLPARSPAAADLTRATAMSIPLHPAAARYYRERELSR